MGCDIHLTLEYRLRKNKVHRIEGIGIEWTEGTEWRWGNFLSPWDRHTWSDRVYGMFAALADVRNYYGNDIKPLEQRGFPEDATYYTLRCYADKVIPDDDYKKMEEDNMSDGYTSESRAKEYTDDGWSKYIVYHDERNKYTSGLYCSGPDWHSPSWCTTHEMKEAFDKIFRNDDGSIKENSDYIEWAALLGAMEGYEASGEFECRAVFWFDN